MSAETRHRLSGLEPDNLLAFMALLGLLRVLEEAEPSWLPRVSWSGDDDPPVRPVLHVAQPVPEDSIVTAAGAGLAELADRHRFEPFKDLKLSPEDAAGKLRASRDDRYAADLWAALVSDAATRDRDKKQEAEPTPLCLLFGQGHQHFLERLGSVPQERTPPARGTGRSKVAVTEEESSAKRCSCRGNGWTRRSRSAGIRMRTCATHSARPIRPTRRPRRPPSTAPTASPRSVCPC